jgi:hypothetical protein
MSVCLPLVTYHLRPAAPAPNTWRKPQAGSLRWWIQETSWGEMKENSSENVKEKQSLHYEGIKDSS